MPSITVRHGEPSRSAHWVAALRAVHQLLDEPLVLPDPIALPLLGASAQAALREDPFALNDPISRGLRAALVARSRFVEDELSHRVAAGVRQYVLLGAGLDTFAYRNPWPVDPRSPQPSGDHGFADRHLRVFEVDHAGTQRWKQQLLAEAGIRVPAELSFVPLDFERDDLVGALTLAGFRADEPACISWMGVTTYLTTDAVLRMLRAMAGLAPGSCVCFDYRVPGAMLDPVERAILEVIGLKAAAAGEPWLSAFDPTQLQAQLLEAGFSSADSTTPDELNARYFARRKDGLRTGGGLRIMCARTGGTHCG
jgi:O-methyltransferase involved in polyketide biosynthesis